MTGAMENGKTIIIWDSHPARIAETEKNLRLAMCETQTQYAVVIMSELPLIARKGLQGKLPSLETGGNIWTWKIGEPVPKEAATQLLSYLKTHG